MRLRLSKVGLALAVTFLCIAGALFALHFHALRTNPANSGESALWFFLCTLPWAFLLPESVTGAPWWDELADYAGWALVAWNAFLLYCLGGGLSLAPRADAQARRSSLTSR
jgi:hypothetical protein